MDYEERYNREKNDLLTNKKICKENRDLFKKFFEWEETKLKRTNNLPKLDEHCYKTLLGYIARFRNVNKWFNNKPWIKLSKQDIQKVYDNLEDGKIKNKYGQRYGDLKSYYGKVFRSKPFELAGKIQLVKEVMEFYRSTPKEDVRYIDEKTFRKIPNVISNPPHKLLVWLAFDIGENVNTLLELSKKDFFRQLNKDSNEFEYRVNLPRGKLKRTRLTRSEITNYKETVELLDIVLSKLNPNDKVFNFEYRQAKKFLDRAVKITSVKCTPNGQSVTWKDLRSSMACDLLLKDWTIDEINARLGHRPSSREIDKYVNFLAIDRHRPKKKIYENTLRKVQEELEETKQKEKLYQDRVNRLNSKIEESDKTNAERWKKMLKFFEKYPEIADEMIKKDWKALKDVLT
jgi:hypothetical protein